MNVILFKAIKEFIPCIESTNKIVVRLYKDELENQSKKVASLLSEIMAFEFIKSNVNIIDLCTNPKSLISYTIGIKDNRVYIVDDITEEVIAKRISKLQSLS